MHIIYQSTQNLLHQVVAAKLILSDKSGRLGARNGANAGSYCFWFNVNPTLNIYNYRNQGNTKTV